MCLLECIRIYLVTKLVHKEYYTWRQYKQDMEFLSGWILRQYREVEHVVGLARGGLVPAVHLSHKLNVPLIVKQFQTRDGNNKDNVVIPPRSLIVDDINDSGKTLSEVVKYCEGDYRTCTIYYKDSSIFDVDFYCRNAYNNWIVFPWEE